MALPTAKLSSLAMSATWARSRTDRPRKRAMLARAAAASAASIAPQLPRRAWAPVSPAARAAPAATDRRLRRALVLRTRSLCQRTLGREPRPRSGVLPHSAARHLVDEPPLGRRHRVDRLPGQRQQRRAVTADAPGDAHRAARAGDQTERHLGQPDGGVRGGDDPPAEGGQLDAGPHARAVESRLHPWADGGHGPGRAPFEADDMSGGRIRSGTELVEVTAARERRPVARQDDERDRRVRLRDRQGLDELIPHARRERVVDVRTRERDHQPLALTFDPHGWPLVRGPSAPGPRLPPP